MGVTFIDLLNRFLSLSISCFSQHLGFLSLSLVMTTGKELCRKFFYEAVKPIVDQFVETAGKEDALTYTAALLGPGSEVIGFDDDTSQDHDWGPRCFIFLDSSDLAAERLPTHMKALSNLLSMKLPKQFQGFSTHFSEPDLEDNGTQIAQTLPEDSEQPVNHRVKVTTFGQYTKQYVGIDMVEAYIFFRRSSKEDLDDVSKNPPSNFLSLPQWLCIPQQKLLTFARADLYNDHLSPGQETASGIIIRQIIHIIRCFYPPLVAAFHGASLLNRIGQEEHLMGRCAMRGDELGASIIAGRLARDLMRLCFLSEKEFAPYPKWFGSAFNRLEIADEPCGDSGTVALFMQRFVAPTSWKVREAAYIAAATHILNHRRLIAVLGLPDGTSVEGQPFFTRPYRVMRAGDIAEKVLAQNSEARSFCFKEQLSAFPIPVGGIDVVTDSTDVSEMVGLYQGLCALLFPLSSPSGNQVTADPLNASLGPIGSVLASPTAPPSG